MMMWAQLMLLPGPSNISLNAGWMLVILSEFSNRCLALFVPCRLNLMENNKWLSWGQETQVPNYRLVVFDNCTLTNSSSARQSFQLCRQELGLYLLALHWSNIEQYKSKSGILWQQHQGVKGDKSFVVAALLIIMMVASPTRAAAAAAAHSRVYLWLLTRNSRIGLLFSSMHITS